MNTQHGLGLCFFFWVVYLAPKAYLFGICIFLTALTLISVLIHISLKRPAFSSQNHIRAGDTALVTGGGSGIGKEIAIQLAKRNVNVVLVAMGKAELAAAKLQVSTANPNVSVWALEKDLTAQSACQELFDEIHDKLQVNISVLVNCAGLGNNGWFVEQTLASNEILLAVNNAAQVRLTSLFAPPMIQRGRGSILFVSSITGCAPTPLQTVYGATKAFTTSFALALQRELKPHNIHVCCLLPGATTTNFASSAHCTSALVFRIPFGITTTTPQFVASCAVQEGLFGGSSVVVPGWVNKSYAYVMAHWFPANLVVELTRLTFTPVEWLRKPSSAVDSRKVAK